MLRWKPMRTGGTPVPPSTGSVDLLEDSVAALEAARHSGMNSRAEPRKSPLKATRRPPLAVGFSRLEATQPGNSFPGVRGGTIAARLSTLPKAEGSHTTAQLPARSLASLALLLTLFAATPAHADLSARASINPQRAEVGETLTLTIEVKGAQNVTAPALSNIDGFDVQYLGPSTQVSIINGQVSASVQHRYSLVPQRQGHFTLGPFTVEYQGQHYQTAAVAVDIGAAAPQPQAPPGQAARGTASGQQLRVTLSAPRTEVYLHEQIPIDVRLYVGNVRVADLQYPTLPGDGLSIDKFPEPSQQRQNVEGQIVQVVRFQTTVIPLRAGTLVLGPASVRLNVLTRRRGGSFGDPFFDQFFQNDPFAERRPMDVRSDPITLTVLPLPEEGKPAGFSGAVGHFSMQVTASPTELNAGDPITLRMNLAGSGSLADALPPVLTNAESFRTYEARAGKAESSGRSFEQVLIPNDANVHAIPSVRFSYFDPEARRYQTLESQPIALTVRPAQSAPRAEVVTGGGPSGRIAPEEKLGRDIVYIKDDPGRLTAPAHAWYRSLPFLLWQPVPLLLFGAAVWYDRRRQRLTGDVRYARFTRAGKQAKRALAAAEHALAAGNRQQFYDELSRTMQEYLAAKLALPPGAIDADAVAARGVSDECARHVRDFLATCEQVRFAPGASDGDMRGTLALAQEVIKQLERTQRSAPTVAAAVALLLMAVRAATAGAPPVSPQTTFFHANALYKDGQYAAAAGEYEQLLRSGLESGNLYFNLGNAYFKAGAKGTAILNYERARRLMPSDPDLEANLAYARSLTGAEACTPAVWERLAFPVAHRMATDRLTWLTSALYTVLLLALASYRLWPRRPRWLIYSAIGAAALVVISGTSLAAQVFGDDWQHQAVVIAEGETPARFEPAENGTVHFGLKEGSLVRVLDTRQGWWQVARCDGRRGWLPKGAVEEL
jgi:tetratricopeptide (TPR) repeat protein